MCLCMFLWVGGGGMSCLTHAYTLLLVHAAIPSSINRFIHVSSLLHFRYHTIFHTRRCGVHSLLHSQQRSLWV